jgi:acetyl-CoA acyltransferase
MPEALIVDALRTPMTKGKPLGSLSGTHPSRLLAALLRELVERNGVEPAEVDDVIAGVVGQGGDQTMNLGRLAVLAAGFPEAVPGVTVDRQCGSSLQALTFAAQAIRSGEADVVIAAGVESMSRIPLGATWTTGAGPGDPLAAVTHRYPAGLVPQGIASEMIAKRWRLTRSDVDTFALGSHRKASAAWAAGHFGRTVVPVKAAAADGTTTLVERDEYVRTDASLDALERLRPAFWDEDWDIRFPDLPWVTTAGNSSPLTDGASAVLLVSERAADRLGLTARARVRATAAVGDDPLMMLTAVIPATRRVLERAGLQLDDVDSFEINEAFASVVLAWQRELGVEDERVNRHGGAIALGHPLGATGTRLAGTLLDVLDARGARFGLGAICEAGGTANAVLLERL